MRTSCPPSSAIRRANEFGAAGASLHACAHVASKQVGRMASRGHQVYELADGADLLEPIDTLDEPVDLVGR